MLDNLNESQRKNLFNAVLATFIFLAVFLCIKAIVSLKEYSYVGRGVYPTNVITVSVTGEVLAIPDTASFSFSVVEESKTVQDAQSKASKKMNSIIEALKTMGVEEKDIKTTSYNSYPKYDYTTYPCIQPLPAVQADSGEASSISYPCRPGKNVLTGYEVSQSITVKVRKTEDAGKVLTKVGDLGASNISGLDFVVDDADKVQAEARDKAITDAKEKAKVLSKSLGIKLKRIVNFYEQGNGPIYYGKAMEAGMGGDVAVSVPPQIPTGENKITSNVSITYEVE